MMVILGILVIALVWFLVYTQIKELYMQDDPVLDDIKTKLSHFFEDNTFTGDLSTLNNGNIINKLKFYKGTKSYTINKRKVYLCMKDEHGSYYDTNMLVYVALHEIAHCVCDEIGHTDKFHSIFNQILNEASIKGLYDPKKPLVQDYCEYSDA